MDHSVGALGAILLAAGREHDPEPDSDFHVRLRTAGQPDLRVVVDHTRATLAWAQDDTDEPAVDMDAGARQLFIWGRRPDHRGRLRSYPGSRGWPGCRRSCPVTEPPVSRN